jgi:uncharacterized coiled-coil protein SlyX
MASLADTTTPPTLRLDLAGSVPAALDVPVAGSEAQILLRTSRVRTIRSDSQQPDKKVFIRQNVDGGGIKVLLNLAEKTAISSDSQLVFSGVHPGDGLTLWIAEPETGNEVAMAVRFIGGESPAAGKAAPERGSIWKPAATVLAGLFGLASLAAVAFLFFEVRKAQDEIRELKHISRKGGASNRNADTELMSHVRDLYDRVEALDRHLDNAPVPVSEKRGSGGDRDVQDTLARALSPLKQRLEDLEARVASQERSLDEVTQAATRNIEDSLKILVDGALAGRLNESASDFFRRAVPERDGLNERLQGGRQLGTAIDGFLTVVAPNCPELRETFQPLREEVLLVENEVEGLLRAPRDQTLQLDFRVSFSTSPASKETIAEALAGGLRREILKLAEPQTYFDRRLRSIGLRAAQTSIEYLDRSADLARKNETFQSAFNVLLHAAGLTAIVPREGDSYSPQEHQVEQTQPSQDLTRSHTVARVVARGLRQDGRVVRKAAVWLYQ